MSNGGATLSCPFRANEVFEVSCSWGDARANGRTRLPQAMLFRPFRLHVANLLCRYLRPSVGFVAKGRLPLFVVAPDSWGIWATCHLPLVTYPLTVLLDCSIARPS